MACTWLALRVYLTKHHKHCQIQIWTSIAKAKRATCTGKGSMRYNPHTMPQDAGNLLQVPRTLTTCCRLRAGLLHTACCMLHITCCWLLVDRCMPFVLTSKCCNRGRNAIYVSCPLYPASATCRTLQGACCVLQAACRFMYFHVLQYWTTRYIPLPVTSFWLLA